ncbi:MAG: DUF3800 domain-containing protein [Microbacterium sp.]|nr:DUF3800 domain-containing protein [Microbacterium sp.]MBA4345581.1 DUF3800 domain-containing protein [Microbacterium sp.]
MQALSSWDIYCDESRPELFVSGKAIGGWTLIGSLWMPSEFRQDFKAGVASLRAKHGIWGEFKWTKVSPSSVDFYLDLVDYFFDSSPLRFRTIAIDSSRLDHATFHSSDAELGFYKFYYQLLTHWIVPGSSFSIFCDNKVNRDRRRLTTLGQVLRNANPGSQVSQLQAVSSSQSVAVQLCDVLMGACQSQLNLSAHGSAAKEAVRSRIEQRIGHALRRTYPSERKFNVFVIELRSNAA